ncbi:MAG: response regulator [Acidobacteriota bacterium]|nr:response regulator [Acidobacteriota bacterium]
MRKILVVDDLDEIRELLRKLLESKGHQVVEAESGSQAIELALGERLDLILMDLFMPKMDGFTALKRIREIEELKGVPVIAVSAYGELGIEEHLRAQSQAAGFTRYLPKPFKPEQLAALLQDLLK